MENYDYHLFLKFALYQPIEFQIIFRIKIFSNFRLIDPLIDPDYQFFFFDKIKFYVELFITTLFINDSQPI